MIQIPSAAGFVPQESVLDGITKLFQTFSPQAKQLRQAQIGQIGAQTNLSQAEANAVPEKTSQAWVQTNNDTTRAASDQQRAANNTTETGLDVARNPFVTNDLQATTAAKIGQLANETQDSQNRTAMVAPNIENLQSEMKARSDQIDQGFRALNMESDKNSQNAQRIQSEINQQSGEALMKLYQMTPEGPERDQYKYQILGKFSPEAQQGLLDLVNQRHAAASDYNNRIKSGVSDIFKRIMGRSGGAVPGAPGPIQSPSGVVSPPVPSAFVTPSQAGGVINPVTTIGAVKDFLDKNGNKKVGPVDLFQSMFGK